MRRADSRRGNARGCPKRAHRARESKKWPGKPGQEVFGLRDTRGRAGRDQKLAAAGFTSLPRRLHSVNGSPSLPRSFHPAKAGAPSPQAA